MRRSGARPGGGGQSLFGTVARTAVIAGTASAVAGRVAAHRAKTHHRPAQADDQAAPAPAEQQAAEAQAAEAQAAPDATASAGGLSAESIARLQQLGDLLKQGILTDEEFAEQKAKVLGG
jgi:predicted lipid-binding transport protein (Tim44 family)